jgi:uncharacterized protein (TIGR03435 family)
MFERYTEGARRVLFFARYEAGQFGSRSVEPEHLLLGLIRESGGVAGRIVAPTRISLEGVRSDIGTRVGRNERVSEGVELPIGPRAQQILRFATEEADGLQDQHVDTEHLLLGILRDEESIAASILIARGLRLDTVRTQVLELRRDELPRSQTPSVVYADPSSEVRMAPTRRTENEGTAWRGGPQRWTAHGARLKDLLSRVCGVTESRIELPASLDGERRYDVALILPHDENDERMLHRIREAIEKYFHVAIINETREMDVYVLTAPHGITATRTDGEAGGGGFAGTGAASMDFRVPTIGDRPLTEEEIRKTGIEIFKSIAAGRPGAFFSMTGISVSNGAMGDLSEQLERGVGRPVVDETNLDGRYDLHAFTESQTTDALFDVLREKFGLVVTPARRDVAMLVVRPHPQL